MSECLLRKAQWKQYICYVVRTECYDIKNKHWQAHHEAAYYLCIHQHGAYYPGQGKSIREYWLSENCDHAINNLRFNEDKLLAGSKHPWL